MENSERDENMEIAWSRRLGWVPREKPSVVREVGHQGQRAVVGECLLELRVPRDAGCRGGGWRLWEGEMERK